MKSDQTNEVELHAVHPRPTRAVLVDRLDYCCHERSSPAVACAQDGLDPSAAVDEVVPEGADAGSTVRWGDRLTRDLIDLIVEHSHARLSSEIPQLTVLAARVERSHSDNDRCPHGLAGHLQTVYRTVRNYMRDSQEALSPALAASERTDTATLVEDVERQQRDYVMAFAHIRDITAGLSPPPDACATWRSLYLRLEQLEGELREHMDLKKVLFPPTGQSRCEA